MSILPSQIMTNIPDRLFEFARIYMVALNYIFPGLSLYYQRMLYATLIIALAQSQQIESFEEKSPDGQSKLVGEQKKCICSILRDNRAGDYQSQYQSSSVNNFRDAYRELETLTANQLVIYLVPSNFKIWNLVLKIPYLAYAQIKTQNRQGNFSNPNEQEAHIWTQIRSHEAFKYLQVLKQENIV